MVIPVTPPKAPHKFPRTTTANNHSLQAAAAAAVQSAKASMLSSPSNERKGHLVSGFQQRKQILRWCLVLLCIPGVIVHIRNLDFTDKIAQNHPQLKKKVSFMLTNASNGKNNNFDSNNTVKNNALQSTPKQQQLQQQQQIQQQHHMSGDFYVPSLEFAKPKGFKKSQNTFACNTANKIKDMAWELFPSNPISSHNNLRAQGGHNEQSTKLMPSSELSPSNRPRLLIGLYSGYDKYAELLSITAHIAKVYATLHPNNVSVVTLQGTAFAPHGCTPPGVHTTINKIRLLFYAIDHTRGTNRGNDDKDTYDQLLLLDADALVANMSTDLTSLLPTSPKSSTSQSSFLLAAQPARHTHPRPFDTPEEIATDIHAGATLWNLHHPYIQTVALDWFERAKDAVIASDYNGDQRYLQEALLKVQKEHHKTQLVRLLDDEFYYSKGTMVKQVLQHSHMKWNDRKAILKEAANDICKQYPQVCEKVPFVKYPTK